MKANSITLERRVSRRYSDAYSSADNWDGSYTFKVLAEKVVFPGNGYDAGPSVVRQFIGSKKVDQDEQLQALRDNLNRSGCQHEYDCCGCASVFARIRKVKPGVFSALISTSYNY